MPTAPDLIKKAFVELSTRSGFVDRFGQKQLALLIGDCIEGKQRGVFEAPTGLGKSLATLIPAIANAIANEKKTVIATYTNVLAEQYWRQDLPLALSLFETAENPVRAQFLIGKQRYACKQAISEGPREPLQEFLSRAKLGIETEFRTFTKMTAKDKTAVWKEISVPPVCNGRFCPHYNDCFYYSARRQVEKAQIVITNHSVVIQDALMKTVSEEELSLLGKFDFLVLDEAHDFLSAAQNGLEFEITESKIDGILHIAQRLHSVLRPLAISKVQGQEWAQSYLPFADKMKRLEMNLRIFGGDNQSTILAASPNDLLEHKALQPKFKESAVPQAETIVIEMASAIDEFLKHVEEVGKKWSASADITEQIRTYGMHLREFSSGARNLFEVKSEDNRDLTYAEGGQYRSAKIRRDLLDFSMPLRGLIWDKTPYACLSATMTLDGTFDFFSRTLGVEPDLTEILESPFDYSIQASLYVPPTGRIPDPTIARREGRESEYHWRVAKELGSIIEACKGRTLCLFSSRKEMEAVFEQMTPNPDYPILIQRSTGMAATGERFKKEINTSLFALRSFWTGFDAPGETLFCVALVRVPFEVPFDPISLGRMAWLHTQGYDPFVNHTLPLAKMMMRQGAGRLIRRDSDRGVIALLDPRLRTKTYGEQIFENMPTGMRTFDDIYEAIAQVGED